MRPIDFAPVFRGWFPGCIETLADAITMTRHCRAELHAWRAAYHARMDCPTLQGRMRRRRALQEAYDRLLAAWRAAAAQQESAQVA